MRTRGRSLRALEIFSHSVFSDSEYCSRKPFASSENAMLRLRISSWDSSPSGGMA